MRTYSVSAEESIIMDVYLFGNNRTTDMFEGMFKEWTEKGTEIDPSLQCIAYSAAMRRSPSATFEVLKEEYLKTRLFIWR